MLLTAVRVILTLTLYAVGALTLGLALVPAALLCRTVWQGTAGLGALPQTIWLCLAIGAGYFLFGFSLMILTASLRVVFRLDLKEGEYPLASWGVLKWYVSNALQFLVWSIFGDFLLLTPFASLFYRLRTPDPTFVWPRRRVSSSRPQTFHLADALVYTVPG